MCSALGACSERQRRAARLPVVCKTCTEHHLPKAMTVDFKQGSTQTQDPHVSRSRRDLSSELASKPSVSAEGRRKTTHQHASLGSRRTRGLGAIPCLLGFDLLLQLRHPIKALLEWRQLPEPSKPYLSFLRPESSAIILQLLAEGTKNKIQ